MPGGNEINVQNRLIKEKRDLNVYHKASKSAYMISHGNEISIELESDEDGDYLHLSVVTGPGSMKGESWITVPSWCRFTVSGLGNGDIAYCGEDTMLKVPPGEPKWQLKITRRPGSPAGHSPALVTIGDDESHGCSE